MSRVVGQMLLVENCNLEPEQRGHVKNLEIRHACLNLGLGPVTLPECNPEPEQCDCLNGWGLYRLCLKVIRSLCGLVA